MVVGAKVCDLTEDLLWFVCGLYVGILTSPLTEADCHSYLMISIVKLCYFYMTQYVGFQHLDY